MHLGHQSVIDTARKTSNNSCVGVVTFGPHPRQYFQKNQPLFKLMKSETRKRFLNSFGIDALFELPFDSSLANLSPKNFIETVLLEKLNVKLKACDKLLKKDKVLTILAEVVQIKLVIVGAALD